MATFIMANRRAGKFRETDKTTARAAVGLALGEISSGINVMHDSQPQDPTARRIIRFEADPEDIQPMVASLSPDVILEPLILYWPQARSPFKFLRQRDASTLASPFNTGTGNVLKFKVRGGGNDLRGTTVTIFFRGPGGISTDVSAVTNQQGLATFQYSNVWTPTAAVISPAGDFWVMVHLAPSGTVTVDCPPLPKEGPLAWWHRELGLNAHFKTRGKGIRVGVIDTGVGPHSYLSHVADVGAFIGGDHDPSTGQDVDSHGSHVCGMIGALPADNGDYAGVAPGCTLLSARVFPGPNAGAANDDIANAIDFLSRERQVDLINMSLGSPSPSQIIKDAIIDALERGTLCICAAGNSDGPVEYPGAFDDAIAVTAIGLNGWGPVGSLPTFRLPDDPSRFGDRNLFHANFSCFGSEVDCCGPGVGILSTVPERFKLTAPFASMGGTSMASPAVCGALAAILSKSDDYKNTSRDETRSALARSVLKSSCHSIGLDAKFQGAGIPNVP